ncbi:ABC transporter ATP-binding protein [Lapidilactobacillus achengensis]|uniref:ABC transporter ATP-binding protein n=1 Tax=Lapidilactobacillus achengensis TaxID=2486000 RepID=A0ABW1UPB0_9LACO|nr:ABC transporter ATP-binding protein [Lapidilactobacillus achengensis]
MVKLTGVKLSKSFSQHGQEQRVLWDLSLALTPGTMTALIGPSGIGKSTLLNILGLLDRDYQGTVSLDQTVTNDLNDRELAHLRNSQIGFVLQEALLIERLTVRKNILLPTIYGDKQDKAVLAHRVQQLATQIGIETLLDKYPRQLSGGQKQRVVLARALINDPDIILADEPTGSLDEQNAASVVALLAQLAAQGKTVLTVTHDHLVAEQHQYIFRMASGQLVKER